MLPRDIKDMRSPIFIILLNNFVHLLKISRYYFSRIALCGAIFVSIVYIFC